MDPPKAPQTLRWLENSTLKNQSPKMDLQKALQALRWLENGTSKNQSPKMDLQRAAGTAMARKHTFFYKLKSPNIGNSFISFFYFFLNPKNQINSVTIPTPTRHFISPHFI